MPTNDYGMNLIQMIRNGNNPQQLVMSVLEQRMSENPFYKNLFDLAKNRDTTEIEKIARNLMREKGLDYDTEFNKFQQTFGFKK